jgi:hypothetical protein
MSLMHEGIIPASIVVAIAVAGYLADQQLTKPSYALEVDATREMIDISNMQYRIRVANVGTEQMTASRWPQAQKTRRNNHH